MAEDGGGELDTDYLLVIVIGHVLSLIHRHASSQVSGIHMETHQQWKTNCLGSQEACAI